MYRCVYIHILFYFIWCLSLSLIYTQPQRLHASIIHIYIHIYIYMCIYIYCPAFMIVEKVVLYICIFGHHGYSTNIHYWSELGTLRTS